MGGELEKPTKRDARCIVASEHVKMLAEHFRANPMLLEPTLIARELREELCGDELGLGPIITP